MIKDALFIAAKDLKYTIRARETILWVFIMPIVFFYFIGTITGGFAPDPDRPDRLAVGMDETSGVLAGQIARRLEAQGYEIIRMDSTILLSDYSRRLTIPANFTDSVLAGNPTKVQLRLDRHGLTRDYDEIRVQRAAYTMLADLIVLNERGRTVDVEGFDSLAAMPRSMSLITRPAGTRRQPPSGFEQAIPGIMVMFTLLVMTTSGAILLVIERKQGLLRRLASTPIDRLGVVLGKWSGKVVVGIVQIAFAMIAGSVLFKMDWGRSLHMVIVVMLAYGAMMAALGVVLGSLARSEGQSIAIGVIASNVLAALGGCWWPIEITPTWMQRLQLFLPTGWAMDALHKMISFGSPPESAMPHILVMIVVTGILIGLSVRIFRFE